MKTRTKYIGVIILAGGNSSRMNYPKAWLYLLGGTTFLEYLVNTYHRAGVQKIVTVLKQEFGVGKWRSKINDLKSKTNIVLNSEVELGRMHSIEMGLKKVLQCDYVFIQNVDSPLVEIATIKKLIQECEYNSIVQPIYNGSNGHPLVISRSIVQDILKTNTENKSLRDVLKGYNKVRVAIEDQHVLMNVNTFDNYLEMKNEFV